MRTSKYAGRKYARREAQFSEQYKAAVQLLSNPNPPPDPDEQNNDRAQWAYETLREFNRQTGVDLADSVGDLLADLAHFLDRLNLELFGGEPLTMASAIRRARMHYEEETDGKGEQFEDSAIELSLDRFAIARKALDDIEQITTASNVKQIIKEACQKLEVL